MKSTNASTFENFLDFFRATYLRQSSFKNTYKTSITRKLTKISNLVLYENEVKFTPYVYDFFQKFPPTQFPTILFQKKFPKKPTCLQLIIKLRNSFNIISHCSERKCLSFLLLAFSSDPDTKIITCL